MDRGRTGSKYHVIVEAHGIPLAANVTDGNRNDVTQLIPPLQAVPPIRALRGRPRRHPERMHADRAYDHDKYRRQVSDRADSIIVNSPNRPPEPLDSLVLPLW